MKKILFICGTFNQTTMMHKISMHLSDRYKCKFTPYYGNGAIKFLAKKGLLDFTVLGGKFRQTTEDYLVMNNLEIDYDGSENDYDIVVTCTDLIVPKNIRDKKIILVQEGMTDAENIFFYLARYFGFPRCFSTSTTGLSNAYDAFCVASEGYKNFFIRKGCNSNKVKVTGIPNFDNCEIFKNNNFMYRDFVLVCTSDIRETKRYENRKKFILNALKIANGKKLIFKLHPNEIEERAIKEIKRYAPGAIVFKEGNTNEMIANCDTLITKFSSVVYIGIALGKKVYSDFDVNKLKLMTPIQNGGNSSRNIASVCEYFITKSPATANTYTEQFTVPVTEY